MHTTIDRAKRFQYHSFHVVEDHDLNTAIASYKDEEYLFAATQEEKYMHLYWACNSATILKEVLKKFVHENDVNSAYIEFVPVDFTNTLYSFGFKEHSEYCDFWNKNLLPVNAKIRSVDIRAAEKKFYPKMKL